jgi:hypothetical protein
MSVTWFWGWMGGGGGCAGGSGRRRWRRRWRPLRVGARGAPRRGPRGRTPGPGRGLKTRPSRSAPLRRARRRPSPRRRASGAAAAAAAAAPAAAAAAGPPPPPPRPEARRSGPHQVDAEHDVGHVQRQHPARPRRAPRQVSASERSGWQARRAWLLRRLDQVNRRSVRHPPGAAPLRWAPRGRVPRPGCVSRNPPFFYTACPQDGGGACPIPLGDADARPPGGGGGAGPGGGGPAAAAGHRAAAHSWDSAMLCVRQAGRERGAYASAHSPGGPRRARAPPVSARSNARRRPTVRRPAAAIDARVAPVASSGTPCAVAPPPLKSTDARAPPAPLPLALPEPAPLPLVEAPLPG